MRYEIIYGGNKLAETSSELAALEAALRAVYPVDAPTLEINRVRDAADARDFQVTAAFRSLADAMNVPYGDTYCPNIGASVTMLKLGQGAIHDPIAEEEARFYDKITDRAHNANQTDQTDQTN